jgi:hypothetical protein
MQEIARVKCVTAGFEGAPGTSTFYFRKRTGLGWDNYVSDLVTRVGDLYTAMQPYGRNTWTWTVPGVVEVIQDDNGALVGEFIGQEPTGTGSGGTNWGPNASGALMKWGTNDIADRRHIKGRTYFVPLITGAYDGNGNVAVAVRQAMQNAGEAYIGSGGEAVVPVVWHRPKKDKTTHVITRVGSSFDVKFCSEMTKSTVLRSRRD